MFLSDVYFQGDLYLPNLKRSGDAVGVASVIQTVGENDLDWYINQYENDYLRKVLGYTLANKFIEIFTNYPVLDSNGNPIVTGESDLIFANETGGTEWTDLYHQIFRQYNNYYESPAANYVYYWLCRRSRTQTSMNGEVRGLSDYTEVVSDANKLVKTWNDMIRMSYEVRKFVIDNYDSYKEYTDKLELCCYKFIPINTWNL